MKAKLLGAVSAAVLLGWVGIANAQGPMQLTDTQLDVVTAGVNGIASATITVMNGSASPVVALAAFPNGDASASVHTSFTPNAANAALQISVEAFISPFEPGS